MALLEQCQREGEKGRRQTFRLKFAASDCLVVYEQGWDFRRCVWFAFLQWTEKQKLQLDSRKPGVTDPSLSYECSYLRVGKSESKWTDKVVF